MHYREFLLLLLFAFISFPSSLSTIVEQNEAATTIAPRITLYRVMQSLDLIFQ